MNYEKYKKEVEKNNKRNEKYLKEFDNWLKTNKLSTKTIRKHLGNVDFYINEYLNYYEPLEMEEGCDEIDNFLGDFFIRKCTWATPYSIKETASSIKKFYKCMLEFGYIDSESYQNLVLTIKENMNEWIEMIDDYNNFAFNIFY